MLVMEELGTRGFFSNRHATNAKMVALGLGSLCMDLAGEGGS